MPLADYSPSSKIYSPNISPNISPSNISPSSNTTAANTTTLGVWDKGVAYYSKSGAYVLNSMVLNSMLNSYAYADCMCKEFKTCGSTCGEVTVGSRVSTAAKKKSKPSEISNPRALATCQLPRATAPFIECPGIAH